MSTTFKTTCNEVLTMETTDNPITTTVSFNCVECSGSVCFFQYSHYFPARFNLCISYNSINGISTKTPDGTDSDSEAQTDSNADAILLLSIVVSTVCMVGMIIFIYFKSRRGRQRSQSVIQEM